MTAPTDPAAMAEWARGLLAVATPGPWVHNWRGPQDGPPGDLWHTIGAGGPLVSGADYELAAAAPDLAAAVVSLAAEVNARAPDITLQQARDLQSTLCTLTASGVALNTSARDLVALMEQRTTERDRLTRVLACERGDAEAAPDGWRLTAGQLWRRSDSGRTIGQVGHSGRSGVDGWSWQSRGTDRPTVLGTAPTALEAMEAADAARESRDG